MCIRDRNGAAEVDMVINIGRLKNKEYDAVREDIRAVKQAVGDKVLKVDVYKRQEQGNAPSISE